MGKPVVKTWTEQLFSITGAAGEQVAVISKEIFHMTDTYVLDIVNPVNALRGLMFVLAIDAENAPGVQAECAAKIEIVKEISLK